MEDGAPGAGSFTDLPLAPGEAHGRRSLVTLYSLPPTHMRDALHVDILVPITSNEGVPFSDASFELFEQVLLTAAGGFTRRSDVEGAWQAPDGRVLHDRSRSYAVTLSASDAEATIDEIDQFIRAHFQQHASFLELVPTKATVF